MILNVRTVLYTINGAAAGSTAISSLAMKHEVTLAVSLLLLSTSGLVR